MLCGKEKTTPAKHVVLSAVIAKQVYYGENTNLRLSPKFNKEDVFIKKWCQCTNPSEPVTIHKKIYYARKNVKLLCTLQLRANVAAMAALRWQRPTRVARACLAARVR